MKNIADIELKLGVKFQRKDLLELAFVHSSYLNENPGKFIESNERLEFLGDAIIGASVAEELFKKNPNWTEGELSQARLILVNGKNLASLASSMQLGLYMYLGEGEDATGGRSKPNNLEDLLEAIVGALFLDQGYEIARQFIDRTLISMLPNLTPVEGMGAPNNPKSTLQETVQSEGYPPPTYETVKIDGPDHSREFTSEVSVDGVVIGKGIGSSKAISQQAAATQGLETIHLKKIET